MANHTAARLKTGADLSKQKSHHRRAEFFALPSLREIFLRSRVRVTGPMKILQFERIILAKPYFF
jgi:hypothetical protein